MVRHFREMMTGSRQAASSGARVVVVISLLTALLWSASAARAADDLYRAQTIVTGQGEANRIIGFAACLEDVLVKVSGALKLAGDPKLENFKSRARDFVSAYSYHDQMTGTPTRDEQGTRDRPYDLTVDFDATKIDDVLKTLGVKPWLSHRPVVGILVEMEQGARTYLVTSDARQSDLQRDSLSAAAAKRGMSIVLPDAAALAKANLETADVAAVPSSTWANVVAGQGAEIVLVGHLTWNDHDLGWTTTWQMEQEGRSHRWTFRGVTFDEAFRRGLGGAAQILSGNGDPT